MLSAPARDDANRFVAQLHRQAPSPRYRSLDFFDRVWEGRQYDDRPGFWTRDVPLRERAPAICYPIARSAGARIVSFVFGEERFPGVQLDPESLAEFGFSEDEAKEINAFLPRLIKAARVKQTIRVHMKRGLACGTSVAIGCLRDGQLGIDIVPAKWCSRQRAANGKTLQLEIRYDYSRSEQNARGEFEDRWYWYRRVITSSQDVTFLPAPCTEDGSEPLWTPDPAATFALEFLPVVWTKNAPDCDYAGDDDGVPLAIGLVDEIEALDFASSQRHRNAQYNAEPQTVAIGVKREAIEGGQGRTSSGTTEAERAKMFHAGMNQPGIRRGFLQRAADAVRSAFRKAPGEVWTIADPQGDIKMLESSGAGGRLLQDDADSIRQMILEALEVVMADPEKLGTGDLSAKALTLMHAPMLAMCDGMRETWGLDGLVPIVHVLLRLIATQAALRGVVRIPGARRVGTILRARCFGPTGSWIDPPIELQWGPYFKPSATEIQASIAAARSATGDQPVLSRKTAIEKVLPFVVDNADAEIAEIEREADASRAGMREMLGAPSDATDGRAGDVMPPTDVQETAMNGAQVASLIEIIGQVATGALPRDAAVNAMSLAFQIEPSDADRILASAGRGFVPTAASPIE